MATVQRDIHVPAGRLFEVLSDGWCYAGWVVGTSHVRAVDADWPAVGAKIHHASGPWPVVIRDVTQVEAVTPGRRLVMTASGKPLGKARIELTLEDAPTGCRVTMSESPVSGPGAWVHNPLFDLGLARRNTEALERLAGLAERPLQPTS